MTSTDAIAAKNAFVFDHEQVRDQNKCVLAAIASVLVMKFKALGNYFRGHDQPRCVVGPRVSLLILS